jgi:sigma-B regulation protein RsbU (phosphoserine phosphatase)
MVTISVYYFYTRNTIEEMTRNNAIFLAENTVNEIEEVVRPAAKLPENLAWMIEAGSLPKDSVLPFLTKLVRHNPTVYASAIAFEPYMFSPERKFFSPYAYRNNGKVDTTYLGGENYNYFLMDWYQIPKTLERPYWSEPYFDEGGGNVLMTTYSVPFYQRKNNKRQFAGIITIDISLDWLTDIVNDVEIYETGYAFLISSNGVYVTHPDHGNIMNETIFTRAKKLDKPKMREIGRDMIRGKSNLTSINLDSRGDVLVYHTRLESTEWALGVVYPHKEMYANLREFNWLIVIIGFIGLTLLTFFTFRIINNLTKPLTKFAKSARKIAGGNFNVALPQIKTNDEMQELHNSFEYMQKALADYIEHLKETTSAKEKIESELRIAKEIQMGMIPHIFPPFPSISELDLYAMLEPAKEVGGDLYDFFLIDDKHLCFAIGDVSGKGVPASLFMAVTRTLLRSLAPKQQSTKAITEALNKSLSVGNESSMFVTFFLAILDIETGEIRYTNAGHNPPLLLRGNGEISYFDITKDIPVGLFEDYTYSEMVMQVSPNDRIFMYTDGITEAENQQEELYGEKRLKQFLTANPSFEPSELVTGVEEDVKKHVDGNVQSDDLTMLCVIYYGR